MTDSSERRLNEALAALQPPPPTEALRRHVLTMAPGRRTLDSVRAALAASLLAAVATVALLGATGESPVMYSAEGEIAPDTLPLVDELAASDAEPEQIALLPLD